MVAVVSGNGLGLLGGSAGVLGSGGQTGTAGLGQAGEGAWINAKTGNLLLQRQDELLAGRGPDIGVVRTYNSQGGFDFDNGDSWQLSLYRKLGEKSTHALNTANSTIKRFEADGSQLTYTFDATLGKYVNRDGSGAYDTLSYDSTGNTWTWRDGDSGLTETFGASPTAGEWRITSVADRDGNTLTYGYDTTSGLITQVTTANGETTLLQYNASRQLTRIDIVTAGNVSTTRVRYEYDSNTPSRLTKVITDLTPQDGSVADNNTFVTTYTYHGTTTRVASITHGDGTQLSFTYYSDGKLQTYTDGSGAVTTLTYNSGNTTVTDALGQVTTLHYDSNGNLTRLQGPAGSGQDVQYAYNARGDVTQVTDSRGNVTQYSYDSQGNRIREQDAAGNVIERDYNASNQLVRQTVYAVADPDGVAGSQQATQPQTSHYIYDANQRLRFAVSPEGRVTEYRYDGYGQQSSVIQHAGTIDLASLATLNYSQDFSTGTAGLNPTLPAGIARVNGTIVFTSTQQTTDAWPNLTGASYSLGAAWRFEVTTPAVVTGGLFSGGIDSGSFGTASYVRHRARFSNGRVYATSYTGSSSHPFRDLGPVNANTTYVIEVVTDGSGGSSLYIYEAGQSRSQGYVDRMQWANWTNARFAAETYSGPGAAGGTSAPGSTNTIVLDNLSVTTPAALAALETWSASQNKSGIERTDYDYDARGLLQEIKRFTRTDAAGNGIVDASTSITHYVRDAAGRLLQSIDARGVASTGVSNDYLTSYVYDGLGRVITLTQYDEAGSAVGSGTTRRTSTSYLDALGQIEVIQADGLRRVSTYDRRGLVTSVQERNSTHQELSTQTYRYDALGRLMTTTAPGLGTTYYMYDSAGRKRGDLHETGVLTEYRYDNAGNLTQRVRYADLVLNGLTPIIIEQEWPIEDVLSEATNSALNEREHWLYDTANRLVRQIDARGYVTNYSYDGAGRLTQTTRYANALSGTQLNAMRFNPPQLTDSASLPVANSADDRITRLFYDGDGLLRAELDAVGYLTEYRYDARGQQVQRIRHAGLTDGAYRASGTLAQLLSSAAVVSSASSNLTRYAFYDGMGQVTGELDDAGYYTTYGYDLAGNRVSQKRHANALVGTAIAGQPPLLTATAPGTTPAGGYILTSAQDQTQLSGYSAFNQLLWQQAADGTVSRVAYDAAGRVVSSSTGWTLSGSTFVATDVRGQQQRYDLQGRLTGELSALGVAALEALGTSPTQAQIDAVWAAYGTRHEYDAAGRRTRTTDANGNQTLFFYDAMGRITYAVRRVRNPANASEWVGEASKREYNALGQLTRERQMATFISATKLATLTGGAQSQITAGGVPTETTNDRVLDYTYHLTGQVRDTKTYLDAGTGQTTTVTQHFNAFGQAYALYTPQVSGRTHLQEFYYDRRGLLVLHKQDVPWSNGQGGGSGTATDYQVRQEWNPFGDLARRIDSRGVIERYGYDKLGRQIAVRTDPDDATGAPELNRLRQLAFDAFDRVIKQTDALGQETLYSYDTANRTVTVTTPEGIVTKTTRNRHGEVIVLVDGLGNESRFAYDKNGNLTSEKRWDKTANVETTVATHGYDTAGLLKLSETDANGNVVAYTYDAAGRVLTRRVDPSGLNLTTTYQYDAKGQAVKVTDANGNVTQTTFDRSGRVIEVAVDPVGLNLRTRYEYDLAGHVLTLTEGYGTAEARRTTYEYDNLGRRLKQVVDPDAAGYTGLKLTTTWTYDGNDNVVARIDGVGTPEVRTTRYTYDALNRLTDTIDALGGVTRNEYDLEGRVVRTTAYAQAISLAGFATPTAHTLSAVTLLLNQTDPNNRVTRSAYDRDGRLRFVIDALGAVTERQYDAAGNLKVQVRYANALAGTLAANTLPQVVSSAASSGAWIIVTSAADRKSTYTYDAFNRLIEKRDGVGAKDPNNAATSIETTESWAYDKVGNVIRHTDVRGQREWFAYDKANRIKRHIDQAGYVTDTWYFAREKGQTLFVTALAPTASAADNFAASASVSGLGVLRETIWTYDAAGRLKGERIEANDFDDNLYTAYSYDVLGQLFEKKETHANNHITRYGYDKAGRLTSETVAFGTAAAATTQYGYDALGNQVRIVDARGVALAESDGDWARAERRRLGYVDAQGNGRLAAQLTEPERSALRALYTTTQQFDTTGRKLAVTDALGATTRTDYNALGDIVQITDALGKIGYFYSDVLGRVTLQVGPDGAVTQTTFDTLGNQTATRRYAARVVGTLTAGIRPQIVASASGVTGPYVLESSADSRQTAVFDALGRTSTIKTWYGTGAGDHYTETFTYDAAGNVLSASARNGAVTTYQYDALGRVAREIRQIDLPPTPNPRSIETRYAYDGEGHLTQKIEAYGLPEQRTTTYAYDGLGRQVSQSGDALTVFDPVAQTSSTVTPTSTRSYDLAGNLLEEIDAAGARTLHFYDAANREIGRVDALGYYTAWTYDPAGNKVGETRYANAVSTSGSAALGTGSAIQVLTAAPAAGTNAVYVLANADQDRTVTYRYDSQGRQIETRIADLEYGLYTQGSYQARIGDAVTRTEYDALGNVIRQTDANGNVTRSYYNAAGQKVGQLDAAGYLTVWTFDARGNTTKQTRYANAVANWSSSSEAQRDLLTLAGMSAGLANATQDRVTDYTFDALGRVLSETVRGVNAGTLDANGVLQTATVADAVTTYTYNGLDKVTSRTDATNARTDWSYDGIGRVTRVEKPQFTDFENALVRPTTDTEYDGLNNVVREIQRGKNNASETDDRITQYEYGAGGYLKKETDPTGAVTEYAIDVMGRITREVLRNRQNAAGTVSTDDVKRYRYDLLGRQTHTIDGGTYNSVARGTGYINESEYNGFGDVIGRRSYVGTAPTEWQEFAKYDKAGRVWMTNSGDGVIKVHMHDAHGNTTLTATGKNITENKSRSDAIKKIEAYSVRTFDQRNVIAHELNKDEIHPSLQLIQKTQTSNNLSIEATNQNTIANTEKTSVISADARGNYAAAFAISGSPYYLQNISAGLWALNPLSVKLFISPKNEYRTDILKISIKRTQIGTNSFGYSWPNNEATYYISPETAGKEVNVNFPATVNARYSGSKQAFYFEVSIFENLGNGDIEIGKKTIFWSEQNQSSMGAIQLIPQRALIKFNGAPPEAEKATIFYRNTATGGVQEQALLPLHNERGEKVDGSFYFDWSPLVDGEYEIYAILTNSQGLVIGKYEGFFSNSNSQSIVQYYPNDPIKKIYSPEIHAGSTTIVRGYSLITADNRLEILEQQSGGVAASSLIVRYRVKGSGSSWTEVDSTTAGNALGLRRGNDLVGDLKGWFSLNTQSAAFTAGVEYEFDLESRDANGNVLTRARADFMRPATGTATISEFTGYSPTTVTFTSIRNASSMKVGYRTANSTGAYTYVTLAANPAGSGRFAWDTSLADDPRQSYPLDIETLAFDADGVLIHKSTATVTLGKDAAVANATDIAVPQVLRATAPAGTHTFTLGYRPAGSTGAYTPITGTLYTAGGLNEVRADLPSGLDYGHYEYRLEAFSASSASLGVSTAAFQKLPVVDAPPVLSWVLSEAGTQTTQSQRYNAFGEIIQSTDARGFVTDFEYNAAGQLVLKREPETDITLANGFKYKARPETRYAYDAAGRLIAVTDANNHTNTQSWLNGADDESQIVLKRQADTGRERFEFDVFGQLRERINQLWDGQASSELNHRTDYAYDKAGRLTSVTHEQRSDTGNQNLRAVDLYDYDEAGNRVRHTNALNKIADTAFDSLGRVVRYQSYGNTVSTYGYQWDSTIAGLAGAAGGGWLKTETDALGRTLVDKIDLYGRTRWHQDMGGRQFTYTYNNQGWLTAQARTDQTGGQDIVFDHYANGFVKSIWDRALGTWTEYRYDEAGNKTYESYLKLKDRLDPTKGAADYHQYATIEYDALNRISKITDPKATIEYEYDAVGNRRRLFSSYYDGVTGARTTQEYWYAYDAMNRFTVTMGRLGSNNVRGTSATGGPAIGTGTEGVALSYNAASQRVQATEASGVVQKYGYTTDGYLLTIRNGSNALTGNRVLDRAGRVTLLESWINGVRSATETLYDDDSRVQSEKLYEGTTHKSTTSYFYFETTGQAAASAQPGGKGALARIVNAPAPGVTGTTLTWSHTYEYWDEAKQNGITVTGSNPTLKHHNKYWAAGYTTLSYDVNGHVTAGSDATGNRTFRYLTNAQGLILTSDELVGNTVNNVTRFQFIDGRPVGEITNDPARQRVDYVQELANKKADKKDYKNWKPISSADFDQNYDPIGERYPGWAAGSYTVRNGDTLQSIARAIWGDAAMWYLLADANGLTGSEALTADTVLTLPNKVTNIHNNSTTFRPYNPAEAMGDISPTLPDAPPPPRKKQKCGGMGAIVVAVVTIAVAVAAPELIPVIKGLEPAMAAMASAAVGNVAGQIVGNAIGAQSGFNFRGFATDVLSAGITKGMLGNALVTEVIGDSLMASAALGSVIRQGVANITGEQRGFSWAAVAGSALGAQVGKYIGGELAGSLKDKFGNLSPTADLVTRGVQGVAIGITSQLTRVALEGGRLNWSAVAADGLGAVTAGLADRYVSAAGKTALGSNHEDLDRIRRMADRIDVDSLPRFASTEAQRLPTLGPQYPANFQSEGRQVSTDEIDAERGGWTTWKLTAEGGQLTAYGFDPDVSAYRITEYAAGERVRALMDGGRMLWPTLDALHRAPRLTSQQFAAEQRFNSSVGPINQSTNHAREYRRQQTLSRIGFAQSWPFSHVAALTTRAFGFSHEESIALGAEIGGTMMLSAPSNGLGPSRPVHRAPIQTLKGLSAPGEIPVVRPPTVRVDVPSSGLRALQFEEFLAPSTGKGIRAAVEGNAIVPIDKVSIYARGGVADVSHELRAMQQLKQTDRKLFDANPENAVRLDRLKSMQHNFERSSDMARQLERVGFTNTPENNNILVNHLLDVGQTVNPTNRAWVPSVLNGPNGSLQVKSTWKIMEDNRAYLNTLMFVPVKP